MAGKGKGKETEAEKKVREALEKEAAERDQEITDEGLAKIRRRTKAAERGNGEKDKNQK